MDDYGEVVTRHVAARLKARRDELRLSLAEVAERADVHRSTVHVVERGTRGITIAIASRLAAALDLSLGELISEAEAEAATRNG